MAEIHQILRFSDRIARRFHPERIILFGSHADGTAGGDSDVDLLVILPSVGDQGDEAMEMRCALPRDFPLDLLVRDSGDTARRYEEWDPLIREALDRGKVLYERDGSGVARQGGG